MEVEVVIEGLNNYACNLNVTVERGRGNSRSCRHIKIEGDRSNFIRMRISKTGLRIVGYGQIGLL